MCVDAGILPGPTDEYQISQFGDGGRTHPLRVNERVSIAPTQLGILLQHVASIINDGWFRLGWRTLFTSEKKSDGSPPCDRMRFPKPSVVSLLERDKYQPSNSGFYKFAMLQHIHLQNPLISIYMPKYIPIDHHPSSVIFITSSNLFPLTSPVD